MEMRLLNVAFPFHFSVDPALRITSVGSSLAKLVPELVVGTDLMDAVVFITPIEGWKDASQSSSSAGGQEGSGLSTASLATSGLTTAGLMGNSGDSSGSAAPQIKKGTMASAGNFARLFSLQGVPFELQLIGPKVSMSGQWAATAEGMTFICSPVIKTNYDLSRFGLDASDFPAHAMAMERIETREKLATLLSQQNKESSDGQSLAYELTVAADLLIRFSRFGLVVDAHALDPNYLALEQGSAMGKNVFDDYPEIADMVKNAIEQLEEHGRPIRTNFELHRENKKYHFEVRIAKSKKDHFVLVGRDTTEHRRLEQRLTYIANHDPLTRLANRGFFERCVKDALQRGTPFAVMFIDMNEFKVINDKHGHPIGDEVLKAIANRLNGTCGLDDIAGRMGGDEFGVLIRNVSDEAAAVQAAERVVAAIEQPVELEGLKLNPKASVGVAIPEAGSAIEVVYRNVDVAMYEAKREESEQNYCLFAPHLLDNYVNEVGLKRDFERALSFGELDVHFQPIKSLMTDEWYGVEALVRWEHPTRGTLEPSEFIALAEESGDIFSIGEQVLRTACSNASRITQGGRELMLNVNVSQHQLADERLVDMLRTVLAETGWSARRLTLEIPENALSVDLEQTMSILNGLRGLGVRVAIDDFGMGQSSLRYLEELPIDMIKLDRELMANLDGDDATGSRLIESVIRLGHTFGFDVVAEGVERVVQEAIVKSFGCRYAQGYLYAKAGPTEHLAGLDGIDVSIGVSKVASDNSATNQLTAEPTGSVPE